jgi:hypothetical protein
VDVSEPRANLADGAGHGLRVTAGAAPPDLVDAIVGGLGDLAFGR